MRFTVLLSVCVSLATTSLSDGGEFSQVRDLPALKLGATDLDAILLKTHALIDASNGPEDSGRETVKVSIDGQDIEIPHLSLASSVAFPNELFAFSYTYHQPDKPISSVTIDLGDSSRRLSVSGESADKISAMSNLLEKNLRRYATPIGGTKFRRSVGVCLSMLFLTSFMISSAYCWKTRNYNALGMPICSALGFLLLLVVPWNRLVPGFVLNQRYSPFFLIRHASEVSVLALVAILAGIPLSYFLARTRGGQQKGLTVQLAGPIDALPLWGLFIAILVVVLLSVECGYRLGKFRRSRREQEKEAPLGTMVGATLGLLAFILAFTFGLAAARFDARRQALLDEANAIGTTYLRAGMLPERGEEVRRLLRDYVGIRLEAVQSGKVAEGIRRSEDIQQKVWTEAETIGQKTRIQLSSVFFVQSLNQMIDLHAARMQAGLRSRIPGAIWLGLFAVASLSLATMGYHAGLSGTRRSLAILAVAVTFSVVIELIADLDRPQEGVLRISQQALLDVQRSMNPPSP